MIACLGFVCIGCLACLLSLGGLCIGLCWFVNLLVLLDDSVWKLVLVC